MLLKQQNESVRRMGCEFAFVRLPADHPKRTDVEEALGIRKAGEYGEKSITFHLGYLEGYHLILHDLRLYDGIAYFQIDTLILFPTYVLLLEVKNRSGRIILDRQSHQMTRIKEDGTREGDVDPVEQVERQSRLLGQWLMKHFSIKMPIHHLVVMSHTKCTLEFQNCEPAIHEKVIRGSSLFDSIQRVGAEYRGRSWSKGSLLKVGKALREAHVEPKVDVVERFRLKRRDFLNGVRCLECGFYYMRRKGRAWVCLYCKHRSIDAHEQALKEYAYLISPWISNEEARFFLRIDSRHVVKRLLKKYSLEVIGTGRSVRYRIK